MQLLLKTLLNTQLAYVVCAPVIAFVVAAVNGFFFLGVDAADITHYVTAQLAKRVAAKQARLDVNTGKAKTLGCKTSDFFIRQAGTNRQGFKVFRLFTQTFKTAFVTRLNVHHGAKCSNGFF